MAVTLNASTSSGFIATSDTSGNLELQSNGTTKATVGSTGLSIGQYNPAVSLITSGAAVSASSTSVDFTGIPSWAKRITVMLSGISTNGTSLFQIQLGDSGGIETTSYVSLGASIDGTNATSIGTSTSGFVIRRSSVVAAGTYTGQAVISNLTGNSWICASSVSADNAVMTVQNGTKTLSDTLDRVRITTVNGTDTFDAGTINILYE